MSISVKKYRQGPRYYHNCMLEKDFSEHDYCVQ